MNRHQVLSGACNSGDHCFAVGSVEGIPFTVKFCDKNLISLITRLKKRVFWPIEKIAFFTSIDFKKNFL